MLLMGDGWEETNVDTYSWEDGNLTKIESYLSEKGFEGDEMYEETRTVLLTYDERRYPNTGVWHIVGGDAFGLDDVMSYAGLLGKTTRNIPVYCHISYDSGYQYVTYTDDVDYNSDGSIACIYYDSSNNYRSRISFNYNQDWSVYLSNYKNRSTSAIAIDDMNIGKRKSFFKRIQERKAQRQSNMLNINE